MKDPSQVSLIVENILQRFRLTEIEETALEEVLRIYRRYWRWQLKPPKTLEDWET